MPPRPRKRKTKAQEKAKRWFIQDERFAFIMGLLTLFTAAFLFLSFSSYLFTWKADQSKLDIGTGFFSNPDIIVDNWAGKSGAAVSNLFIHHWFGIASFSLIFILVIAGFRLMRIRLMPFRQTLQYVILGSIWLSVFLGYTAGMTAFILGGGHGYYISRWLNSAIGTAGTAFLLIVALAAFIVYTFAGALPWATYRLLKLFGREIKVPQMKALPEHDFTMDQEPETEDAEVKIIEPEDEETEKGRTNNTEKTGETPKNDTDGKDVGETKEENGIPFVTNIAENDEGSMDTQIDEQDAESGPGFTVEETEEEVISETEPDRQEHYDPDLDLSNYQFPGLDLLNEYEGTDTKVSHSELEQNKNEIVKTLESYNITISSIKANVGPTITLYEIVPGPGIRISKIQNLEKDIALSLAALGIRIIAPLPGRGTIGIEVPNKKPRIVSIRSVLGSKKFQQSTHALPVAMGKTISNETYVFDLAKTPHLLVAGATGQGKSVGLNTILASLLYKVHPARLKFVLVDPKMVELSLFERIKNHYLAQLPNEKEPIITDTEKVLQTLNSLTTLMDARYELLKNAFVKNIKEYNEKFVNRRLNPEKGHHFMPYIVMVIDEFADLIMTAGKEVELPIARIAQKARAVGIHMVIATQRPAVNVITGNIKANFPARIAFRVLASQDSRTILDQNGANQLVGKGDMLISMGTEPVRLQCAFIDTPEIEKITRHIADQQAYPSPFMLPEPESDDTGPGEVDLNNRDNLFEEVARLVVMSQQGSIAMIQRKFSIGFNRAGRIVDQMEVAGIVGPSEGSKSRKVLYTDLDSLERFLETLS